MALPSRGRPGERAASRADVTVLGVQPGLDRAGARPLSFTAGAAMGPDPRPPDRRGFIDCLGGLCLRRRVVILGKWPLYPHVLALRHRIPAPLPWHLLRQAR